MKELGGSVATGKSPIPAVAWFGICTDSEGNVFGVLERDESVPKPEG